MSDGSTQLELSSVPLHYRDGKGKWRDIDTEVLAGSGQDAFANATNVFRSRFGKSTDQLAGFEAAGKSITLGAAGDKRALKPKATGSTVTYPDVFGDADVRYRVSPTGLKEDIVLARESQVAEAYTFELRTEGLVAKQRPDGSIGFYADDKLTYLMPAPFMFDSSKENGLGQAGYSEDVTQTLSERDGKTFVTLKPDQKWLTSKDREYPVVIDPSITIAPDPGQAQDALVSKGAPTNNYASHSNLNVGLLTASSMYRSLLKFDTSLIPVDTPIRSADLNVHFASTFGSDTNAVPLSAHEVTSSWSESTVTWNTMPSHWTAHYYNRVQVDDQDTFSTSYEGPWKDSVNSNAIGGSMSHPGSGTTPDTFTWDARVPGPGDYKVEAHYIPSTSPTRGSPTYTITNQSGSTTTTVNQTSGASTGVWAQLTAAQSFAPEQTTRVTMTRQGGTTNTIPVADAVRWTEYSKQTKESGQRDAWHSYAVGSLVEKWVDNRASNHGFMLKATDEAGPIGGVFYNASEDVYGGETNYRPKLVVTYDEPGVNLDAPLVIHSNGPELKWSKYVDPTPEEDDNLVEYQIFRGCTTLPGGACANPVGEHYTTSNPAGLKLVGTVDSDVTAWTDTTAEPSTASEDATYNYWVVARTVADTQNGQNGRAASNVQTVTVPREGRIVRGFTGDISDTTLSSLKPTTALTKPDGRDWLQVGNGHATYGEERAVFEFDTAAIKQAVKVTDARVELFESRGDGTGTARFDLHALTKDFVESQATWNQATSTINWSTAGGDFESTPLANVTTTNSPKRLTFTSSGLQSKVQAWVNNPGDNHGFLLKAGDSAQQYLSLISSESSDSLFRPRLYVEHLAKNDAQTYEADEIPERFVPGTTITTPVTVTNTSNSAWPAGLELSYRWTEPNSTDDITVEGDRNYVALGKALQPGESVKLELPIRTPINSDTGAKRLAYDLYLDLWTGSQWFSTNNPPSQNTTQPTQGCAVVKTGLLCVDRYVEDPTSNQLGLEKFLSYAGEETGAGSQFLTNLYSGNAVWSYDAISNPSLGPSTFVRIAYNSMDGTDAGAGYGVSVQPSTLTRLGGKLSVPSGGSLNKLMWFIDGDGTTHRYKHDEAASTSSKLSYTRPAGVSLELYRNLTESDPAKQWVLHRPDGTRFYFSQSTGLPTSVADRNGNTLSYTHDANGRLTAVKDAAGRTTLSLGYDTAGLEWIRDISGRGLKFGYNTSHQLTKLEDGGGFNLATKTFSGKVKVFQFGYTEQSVNENAKLNSITDPRAHNTTVEYFAATEVAHLKLKPKRFTDRRGYDTTFTYTDPNTSPAKDVEAEVTDVNGSTPSVTTYRMDGYGRTTRIRDANANADGATDQVTKLGWDSDHNVIRLEEPNGAVSTWEYSPVTGYPLRVRDAMAVKNGQDGIVLTYETLPTGAKPTLLKTKTSAAGRETTFTYDAVGNLKTVRNELEFGPTYTYNANGTLDTATDANGGVTTYSSYDANGYPKLITDPLTNKTEFIYDDRGNVMQVKDALGQITTAEYDEFGRPTVITTPHQGTEARTATTDYDLNDNVLAETAPNGAVASNTYGAADNLATTTLPDNNVTSRKLAYDYDPLGRVIQETAPKGVATTGDPNDFVTKYTYDRIGQVLKVEVPFVDTDGSSKTAVTTYGYDVVGNKIIEIDPNKSASAASDYTAKMVYDLNHRVTAITDAAGYTSKNEYDADGLLTAEIDALGNKRRTEYDEAGQKTKIHVPHTPNGSTTTQDRVTKFEYDKVGNVVKEIRPSGKFTETVYDKNNRPIQKKSAFDPASTDYKNPSSTFLKYDAIGQLERQSEPTFGTAGTHWTDFTYHPSGDIKTSTDPWNITATYDYNKLGKQLSRSLKAESDDATRSQSWSYYPDGSIASRSDTEAREPTRVVDNSDTWQATATGTWLTVSGGINTQGSNYHTHAAASGSTDKFEWKVTPEMTGDFDVFVSCPVNSSATTAATYTINHNGGSTTKTINQKACTSSTPWISLGNFNFPGGSTRTIELKPSTSGLVLADAVKLVSTKAAGTRSFTYTYDANGAQTQVKDTTPGALVDTFAIAYDGLGRTAEVQELAGVLPKRETDYTYDLNSNVLSTDARRPADSSTTVGATRFTKYTWDVRNLVDTVESGATPTSTPLDKWIYKYDPRGMRSMLTKPNSNVITTKYHEDGLLRTMSERRSNNVLVASHTLKFNSDGDRSEDVEKLHEPKPGTGYLDQVSKYTYTPARQLASVTKTGADDGDNESYVYDAAGNATKRTIGSSTLTMTYDRNRLVKTVTGSTTMNHRYDVFGRASTVDVGSQVIERNNYDGFDRLIRQQKWNSAGVRQTLKSVKFDPFDRTSWHGVLTAGSSATVHTRFVYLGLQDEVAAEERSPDNVTYSVSKAFTHGPGGEKLALVDSPPGGTTKKHFYSVNPHGDVETLTDGTGETTGTYRYTAYGSPDKKGTLGADAIQDDPVKDADIVNPYRFNSKRFDGATGTYDMGFREYDPGLNRFLTRDMYNGALADMNLGTDPWTVNRYAYAGGNPITGIELDGHRPEQDMGEAGTPESVATVNAAFLTGFAGPASGPVGNQVGVTNVVAPNLETYVEAYQGAEREFHEDGAHTSGLNCTSPNDKTVHPDGELSSCAHGLLAHATYFGLEMCRQPGMKCGDQDTTAKLLAAGGPIMFGGAAAGIRGVSPRFVTTGKGVTIDRTSINPYISAQRQGRHVLGARQYSGGSYFRSADDAQTVLNEFRQGTATILGVKGNDIVVRTYSVTGYNHNPRSGYLNQSTNVFFIKGTSSPSVVPTNPMWKP